MTDLNRLLWSRGSLNFTGDGGWGLVAALLENTLETPDDDLMFDSQKKSPRCRTTCTDQTGSPATDEKRHNKC